MDVAGEERTHWTDSLRRDLDVRGVAVERLREVARDGVVEGTRVPFRFANAVGSMLLRRRWPPLGMSEVSTV